jgi:hypothetical protein
VIQAKIAILFATDDNKVALDLNWWTPVKGNELSSHGDNPPHRFDSALEEAFALSNTIIRPLLASKCLAGIAPYGARTNPMRERGCLISQAPPSLALRVSMPVTTSVPLRRFGCYRTLGDDVAGRVSSDVRDQTEQVCNRWGLDFTGLEDQVHGVAGGDQRG